MRLFFSGSILAGIAAVLVVSSLHHLPPPRTTPRPVVHTEAVSAVPRRIPPVCIIHDFETEKDRYKCFPGYETPGGIKGWLSDMHAVHGKSSLKVVWREKHWGQLAMIQFPENWREYKVLAFEVYNPGAPFEMEVRVGEWYNRNTFDPNLSRFVLSSRILTGANSFRVSLDDVARKIRLNAPRKIIHFSVEDPKKEPHLFYLDYVRLEQ